MRNPMLGRTEEAGMTEGLEEWVLPGGRKEAVWALWAKAADCFDARLGVAATWRTFG